VRFDRHFYILNGKQGAEQSGSVKIKTMQIVFFGEIAVLKICIV